MSAILRISLGAVVVVTCALAGVAALHLGTGRRVAWLLGVREERRRAIAIVCLAAWAVLALAPWATGWALWIAFLGTLIGLVPLAGAAVMLRQISKGERRRDGA